jgi:hypothetical protein
MLFVLLEEAKPDANSSNLELEKYVMMIYNLFIKAKIDEFDAFNEFLVETIGITKTKLSDVFLSQLSTEDTKDLSHEKMKLLEYVQNFPLEKKENEDQEENVINEDKD